MICMHLHCDSLEWLHTGYWISLTELPKCRDRHCDADGEVTDRAASVWGEECAAVCAVECRALVTMALNVGTMMFAATRDTLDTLCAVLNSDNGSRPTCRELCRHFFRYN